MDDEDKSITAGSIVTVTVSLRRKNMMTDFDINKLTGSEIKEEEEVLEEKEVEEEGTQEEKEEKEAKVGSLKLFKNNRGNVKPVNKNIKKTLSITSHNLTFS